MWNISSDGSIHIDCQVSRENMVIDFDMTVKLLPGFLLSDPTGFKSSNTQNLFYFVTYNADFIGCSKCVYDIK